MHAAIDIGETFTGLLAVDPGTTRRYAFKCLTTPGDLSKCFVTALENANPQWPGEEFSVVHGTKVATNALLQGEEQAVRLLTTEGFRGVTRDRQALSPPALRSVSGQPPDAHSRRSSPGG